MSQFNRYISKRAQAVKEKKADKELGKSLRDDNFILYYPDDGTYAIVKANDSCWPKDMTYFQKIGLKRGDSVETRQGTALFMEQGTNEESIKYKADRLNKFLELRHQKGSKSFEKEAADLDLTTSTLTSKVQNEKETEETGKSCKETVKRNLFHLSQKDKPMEDLFPQTQRNAPDLFEDEGEDEGELEEEIPWKKKRVENLNRKRPSSPIELSDGEKVEIFNYSEMPKEKNPKSRKNCTPRSSQGSSQSQNFKSSGSGPSKFIETPSLSPNSKLNHNLVMLNENLRRQSKSLDLFTHTMQNLTREISFMKEDRKKNEITKSVSGDQSDTAQEESEPILWEGENLSKVSGYTPGTFAINICKKLFSTEELAKHMASPKKFGDGFRPPLDRKKLNLCRDAVYNRFGRYTTAWTFAKRSINQMGLDLKRKEKEEKPKCGEELKKSVDEKSPKNPGSDDEGDISI